MGEGNLVVTTCPFHEGLVVHGGHEVVVGPVSMEILVANMRLLAEIQRDLEILAGLRRGAGGGWALVRHGAKWAGSVCWLNGNSD